MVLEDNEAESCESFVAGQCPKNSEGTFETASIEIASASVEKVVPPPTEFYTALEAEKMKGVDWDMRPHVFDKMTKNYLLLDTGAQCSAYPPDPGDKPDPKLTLKAVNGSKMKCYGFKEVDVQINRKKYRIKVVKTDVKTPILGWDFVRRHRVGIGWSEFGDALFIDRKNNISAVMKYKAVLHSDLVRIAEIKDHQLTKLANCGSHSNILDLD